MSANRREPGRTLRGSDLHKESSTNGREPRECDWVTSRDWRPSEATSRPYTPAVPSRSRARGGAPWCQRGGRRTAFMAVRRRSPTVAVHPGPAGMHYDGRPRTPSSRPGSVGSGVRVPSAPGGPFSLWESGLSLTVLLDTACHQGPRRAALKLLVDAGLGPTDAARRSTCSSSTCSAPSPGGRRCPPGRAAAA